jgi:hypothetical protein
MIGNQVRVLNLDAGDLIHIEPHKVDGQDVGNRETDAEVTAVIETLGRVIVEWRGNPGLLGGSHDITGATVYERAQGVVRFGHAA